MLKVKQCKVNGKNVYGLTNGKKWFYYAYISKDQAESMLVHFVTEMDYTVNICHQQPFKVYVDEGI